MDKCVSESRALGVTLSVRDAVAPITLILNEHRWQRLVPLGRPGDGRASLLYGCGCGAIPTEFPHLTLNFLSIYITVTLNLYMVDCLPPSHLVVFLKISPVLSFRTCVFVSFF